MPDGGENGAREQAAPTPMAPFRFSLQPVLDRRTAVEAEKRQAMLHAQRTAARETARLRGLEADLHRRALPLTDVEAQRETGSVRRMLLEIELIRTAIERQQRISDAASRAAAAAREAFSAARAERSQLESLRDLKYQALCTRLEQRESAELDDSNAKSDTISP